MDNSITLKTFESSLDSKSPPHAWSLPLKCLWYDAKGDWEASHNIAQDLHDDMGSWLHAYLHRKEGDQWNADYWYRRAGRRSPNNNVDQEFSDILKYVLQIST